MWLLIALLVIPWVPGLFSKRFYVGVCMPCAGIAPALVAAIPGIIGALGSLFGRKRPRETQYAAQMDPLALQYRRKLLPQIAARMGKPTAAQGIGNDVVSMMYKNYFGGGGPYA